MGKRWMLRQCGPDLMECKCPHCEFKDFVPVPTTMTTETYRRWIETEYYFNRNYCPNCGADMNRDDPIVRGERLDRLAELHGIKRNGLNDRALADKIIQAMEEAVNDTRNQD